MANRKVSGFRAVINTRRVEIMAAVAKMAVRLLPTLSLKVRDDTGGVAGLFWLEVGGPPQKTEQNDQKPNMICKKHPYLPSFNGKNAGNAGPN